MSSFENNGNLIRHVAVAMVVTQHLFMICRMRTLTGGLMWVGHLGVMIFFALSGALMVTSLQRNNSVVYFTAARALRIYPGLVVVLVLLAVAVGPCLTTMDLGAYFQSRETYAIVYDNIFHAGQGGLPGVSGDDMYNSYLTPLWSIYYELRAYALIVVMHKVGLLRSARVYNVTFWTIVAVCLAFPNDNPLAYGDRRALEITLCFLAGAWAQMNRTKIRGGSIVMLSVVSIILFFWGRTIPWSTTMARCVFGIAMAPVIRHAVLECRRRVPFFRVDISYGLYLVHWPVLLILSRNTGIHGPAGLLAATLAVSVPLALLLSRFVEQPSLRMKTAFAGHPQPAPDSCCPVLAAPHTIFRPGGGMFLGKAVQSRAREIFVDLLRLVDVAVVAAAGVLAYYLRHGNLSLLPVQFDVMVVVPVAMSYALHLARAYAPGRALNILAAVRSIGWATGLAALALLGLGFATKSSIEISRVWMATWIAIALPLLVGVRVALRLWLDRSGGAGLPRCRVVVVGAEPVLGRLVERIGRAGHLDVVLMTEIGPGPREEADLARALEAIDACARATIPDSIVIAVPGERATLIPAIAAGIRQHWANIEICPDHAFVDLPFSENHTVAGVPVLRLATRPLEGWQGVAKWLEDRILGLAFTVLALPLMAVVAAIIPFDSRGPVLFRQKRFGFSGREFTLYKFRTMTHAADDTRQASPGDSRVTPFGRFLRRTSLDELPQLFNVLNGTMSLVGPRPHAVPHELHFAPRVEEYLARHRIKPGITGWAQVHGLRGETVTDEDMRRRVEHDIFYIEHWSLELDLLILARTLAACVGGRNAY